jgi:tRNA A-37 threonylcarbamoyl transferase component Bud32
MDCTACHHPNTDGARFCQKCGAPLPVGGSESDPLIGKMVGGRYRVLEVIGEGGMGRVYVGEQQMGTKVRKVAIKTLLAQFAKDHNTVGRFMREAGTISELEHPNTIKVYDFGQVEGTGEIYVAMEFLQGQSLEQALLHGPLPPDRVDNILRQVCGSLAEAHDKGIVHRDLKPANIFLTTRAGEQDTVKVLDFGIAKTDDKDSQQKLTQQGTILGTPPYMSPEQFTGKQLDARSDVYSLAVVTYEMLTGRLPFEADTPWEWATQHMTARPFPFEATPIGNNIPEKMRHAIMRALNKDREQRHQNVREYFEDVTLGGAGQRLSMVGGSHSMPGMQSMPGPITGSMGGGMSTGQMASARGGGTQIGAPAYAPVGGTMADQGGVPAPMGAPGAMGGGGYGAPAIAQPPPPTQAKKGGAGPLVAVAIVGLVALLGGGAFLATRGKETEPEVKTIPTGPASATVVAENTTVTTGGAADPTIIPTTTDTSVPATSAATPRTPPTYTAPTSTGTRPSGGNIDGCCAGARRDKKAICNSINQRVKSGQTSREQGVNAVRAQGIKCN